MQYTTQEKTNKFLMEQTESLEASVHQLESQTERKIRSQNDNMKLVMKDLKMLDDLVKLAHCAEGVIGQLSLRIQDDIDKGVINELRDQFAQKTAVEKEVMKLQNSQRKIAEE